MRTFRLPKAADLLWTCVKLPSPGNRYVALRHHARRRLRRLPDLLLHRTAFVLRFRKH